MKTRLDTLLLERGLADTRARAQALIRAGAVDVNGQRFDKPGMSVDNGARIDVRAPLPYVSRGGYKLAAALEAFQIDPSGWTGLDVGASTGGFTDVLLQRGAEHVFAVDVGRGQLAWPLRLDPRVTNLERTDIRTITALPALADLAVVDVAFISLRLVLPAVTPLLTTHGQLVALIKPQFEVGRAQVGRGGIVRDRAAHASVVRDILRWLAAHDWRLAGTLASPITGADGNREFLVWAGRSDAAVPDRPVETLVTEAMGAVIPS